MASWLKVAENLLEAVDRTVSTAAGVQGNAAGERPGMRADTQAERLGGGTP